MVDVTEMRAKRAIDYARKGDFAPLIEYLESPNLVITSEVRTVLVQIIKGDLKPPPNRIGGKAEKVQRDIAITRRFTELQEQGSSVKSILIALAQEFGVSQETVRDARKAYQDDWKKRSDV